MKYAASAIVLFFLFLPGPAQAASVYEEGLTIVVLSHEGLRKLVLPEELRSASSFTLIVHPRSGKGQPSSDPGGGGGLSGAARGTSLQEGAGSGQEGGGRQTVSSLLYRANRLFHKKKFPEAMSILETAEAMEPNNAKVKTMKGSLFLMMGFKEFAAEAWNESLKLDPEQADLKLQLEKLKTEGVIKPGGTPTTGTPPAAAPPVGATPPTP
ncbi:MAG: hypothetical protein HYY44_02450 [Deltaproteobacteria bacterium]|nr:hypothetical protein [Deltaproteobacteria bacterium]